MSSRELKPSSLDDVSIAYLVCYYYY